MRRKKIKPMVCAVVVWIGISLLDIPPSQGQTFDFGLDDPITIQADKTLEWHKDLQAYVARDNVRLQQRDTTIQADVLVAYYHRNDNRTKTPAIKLIVVEGNVRISLPQQTISAQRGEYNVEAGVFILTGEDLRWTSEDKIITARDSLEFYDRKGLAVARGKAMAIVNDQRMQADVIIGQFVHDDQGQQKLQRIDGQHNVLITTPTLMIQCDDAIYLVPANRAILLGNVRLTQGQNRVNADRAEIDFNTKISRMIGIDQPVYVRIIPQEGQ